MSTRSIHDMACRYAVRAITRAIIDEARTKVVDVVDGEIVVEVSWDGHEWEERVPFTLGHVDD